MRKNQLLQGFSSLTLMLFMSSFCFAQVTEEWVARYNGPDKRTDNVTSMVVDNSKNVYVTGSSNSIAAGYDYVTIKYNENGELKWLVRYNGPGNDHDDAKSMAVDKEGNVYVTGTSEGGGTDEDFATIKYNKDGVQQWVTRYNGPANGRDGANYLAVDGSGNVYVTGYSGVSLYSSYDCVTIKYNKDGVQQWVARYNGPGKSYDQAFALVLDASGNVYITGGSSGTGTWTDYVTIKYNTAGVQQWVARYNGPANNAEEARALSLDILGKNVYVTGFSYGPATTDYATIRIDAWTGAQVWAARYNGPGNNSDGANFLAVDASGNVYVTGTSTGIGTGIDYATIKYNSSGTLLWVARYNGPGTSTNYDPAFGLALDASSNVYVTGSANSDIVTIKYNTAGAMQWLKKYDGPGESNDTGSSIIVDGSGNVYVSGYSTGIGTMYDYTTIKYFQAPAIASRPVPVKLSLDAPPGFRVSNYPNPVSAATRIEYELPYDGKVNIKIYDVLGREVTTLINADKKAGYHNANLNVSSFQSGVYYYRIILNGEKKILTQSEKMIVVK